VVEKKIKEGNYKGMLKQLRLKRGGESSLGVFL